MIAVWLASDRKITPENMSKAFRKVVDMGIIRLMAGSIDMNTEKGIRNFGNMMKKNAAWGEAHPEYPNTWKFGFDDELHKKEKWSSGQLVHPYLRPESCLIVPAFMSSARYR